MAAITSFHEIMTEDVPFNWASGTSTPKRMQRIYIKCEPATDMDTVDLSKQVSDNINIVKAVYGIMKNGTAKVITNAGTASGTAVYNSGTSIVFAAGTGLYETTILVSMK